MFKLTNVSKKYKNNIVVESVSIDMSSPGLYIFQGINGSGKSTILKILAGIIYKTFADKFPAFFLGYLS